MSKQKKDRKAMQQRKQKKLEKQKQKKKQKQKMPAMVEYDRAFMPGISEMDVNLPDGFRAVSNSQAFMEYSQRFVDAGPGDDHEMLDKALTIGQIFWNHALSIRLGTPQEEAEEDILGMLYDAGFPGEKEELREMLRANVERFNIMFPEDMQENAGPRHMILRNIEPVVIEPYDYSSVKLSEEIVPPKKEDEGFLQKLLELDRHILQGSDYSEYEEIYIDMAKLAMERFDMWLVDKNAPESMRSLWGCLEIFISFVYAYGHARSLKEVSQGNMEEFFYDHLLRKMTAEPDEYVEWPAAIKFFYKFLEEKEYMDGAATVIKAIDQIEPFFFKVLKKRFG